LNPINLRDFFTLDLRRVDWPRTGLLIALILAVFAAGWQYAMPQVRTITETRFSRTTQIKRVVDVQRVYIPCPERGIVALDKTEVAKRLGISWLIGGNIAAAKATPEESPVAAPVPAAGSATAAETKAADVVSTEPDLSDLSDGFDATLPEQAAAEMPPVPGRPADLQVTATATLPESHNGYDALALFNSITGVTDLVAQEKSAPWWQFRNKLVAGVRYGVGVGNGQPLYTGTVYGGWEFLRVKDVYLTGYGEINTGGEGKVQADMQWRPR
jgi:hypothetical protein